MENEHTESAEAAIQKMVRLALVRHRNGVVDYCICFDKEGVEVSWKKVVATSKKEKTVQIETGTPQPGIGYWCHICLRVSSSNEQEERLTFEIATPSWRGIAFYVQPQSVTARIVASAPPTNTTDVAVLAKIGHSLR